MKRVYTCWMLLEPAHDVPGMWVSHCLNFDVISQGASPQGAMDALSEAIFMTVIEDLESGIDPLDRAAPKEEWDRLEKVVRGGQPIKLSDVEPGANVTIAMSSTFEVERVAQQHPVVSTMPIDSIPTACFAPAA